MKVEMFHAFYQRIEEIQTTIIRVDPLVVENIDYQTKTEINSTKTECDPDFDDNDWFAECDDGSLSESLTS